jgi:cytochrome P450
VFGAGKRGCIGAALATAELRTFLAVLARSYAFELDKASLSWAEAPFPVARADCASFSTL